MASNYPDGMRESDIPGFDDVDCPVCRGRCEDRHGALCWFCDGAGSVDKAAAKEYWDDQRY